MGNHAIQSSRAEGAECFGMLLLRTNSAYFWRDDDIPIDAVPRAFRSLRAMRRGASCGVIGD